MCVCCASQMQKLFDVHKKMASISSDRIAQFVYTIVCFLYIILYESIERKWEKMKKKCEKKK